MLDPKSLSSNWKGIYIPKFAGEGPVKDAQGVDLVFLVSLHSDTLRRELEAMPKDRLSGLDKSRYPRMIDKMIYNWKSSKSDLYGGGWVASHSQEGFNLIHPTGKGMMPVFDWLYVRPTGMMLNGTQLAPNK